MIALLAAGQISRYPVLRPLGSGGMGEVYLARDPELDREIALKVLRAETDRDEAIGRLREEARAVAGLRHPNIVTVYEIGADGDRAFIAMEYIDGVSLRQRFEDDIADVDLLEAGARVARALDAAHDAGVLHRDIKPDNVMIDRRGEIKVVDFGIAHRLDGDAPGPLDEAITTRVNAIAATIADTLPQSDLGATAQTIFGTPAYMAPEVICGQPPLPASDVYALGVMLYEGLADHLPYPDKSVLEALTLVADPTAEFQPLAGSRPDLDPAIVELVESMMAFDPEQRPTAAEAAARLEALCVPPTEPVEIVRMVTRPPAPPSRAPWVVAAGGVAMAAVALAVLLISRGSTPSGSAAARRAPIKIAVAPIAGDYSRLGHSSLKAGTVANALARALASTDAVDAVALSVTEPERQIGAARAAGASLLFRAELEPDNKRALGRFAIVDLRGQKERHRGEIESTDVAGALAEMTRSVLETLDAEPADDWPETNARVSFELGLAAYRQEAWASARLFLEQAVRAHPDFPSAWFYLTWARGWAAAPAESTREAARRALETARTDLERGLGRAVGLFMDQRFREAAGVLAPLLEKNAGDRDLLYTYAESLFHDGQIEKALRYFDLCLEVAPEFLPALQHPRHVAIARKDTAAYRRFQVLSGDAYEGMVAYMSGNDEEAAGFNFNQTVLDLVAGRYRELDRRFATDQTARALTYAMGRALQLGTRAAAKKRFAEAWPEIAAAAEEPRGAFALQLLVRTLVIGGYRDELAKVRRWWDQHQTPVNLMARQELAVFAAALLDAPLPSRDGLTTRLGQVTDGIEALRRGRADQAVEILGPLADVPTGSGADYVIWHALAQALRAAGRRDELREACDGWRRPGFVDESIIALWAYCDDALR